MTRKKNTLSEKAKQALITASNSEHLFSDHYGRWLESRMDTSDFGEKNSIRRGLLQDTSTPAHKSYTDARRLEQRYLMMYRCYPWKASLNFPHILSSVIAYTSDPARKARMLDATKRTPLDNWQLWKRLVESTYTELSKMPKHMGSALITYATFEVEVDEYIRNVYGHSSLLTYLNEEKKNLEAEKEGAIKSVTKELLSATRDLVEKYQSSGRDLPDEIEEKLKELEEKGEALSLDEDDEDTSKQVAVRIDMLTTEAMLYHAGVYSLISDRPLYDPATAIDAPSQEDLSASVEESNDILRDIREVKDENYDDMAQEGTLMTSTSIDHQQVREKITLFASALRDKNAKYGQASFPFTA